MHILRTGMLLCGAVAILAPAATPGRHPRYLRARSDLRSAQYMMRVHDEPNVMRHARAVESEIDFAIREIDHAAVLDRKDVDDHPRIDISLDRPGRFRKVMALLVSARKDIAEEEDNPQAISWRDAAYHHIDVAIEQLRKAGRELRIDRIEGY